jgi:hypothetical protein
MKAVEPSAPADRRRHPGFSGLSIGGVARAAPVVEVETPAGKRVLHVGRPEGESQRYYARVPDKDRGDVFVIAEADAGRIVRDLPSFTGATKAEK